jgi:hypothetical protein
MDNGVSGFARGVCIAGLGVYQGGIFSDFLRDISERSDFMESMETFPVRFKTFQHVRWVRIEIHDAVTPATWKS